MIYDMNKRVLFIACCVLFLASCSPLKYTMRAGFDKYSREVPVVIAPYNDVSRSGYGELVRQLLANGYDVIDMNQTRMPSRDRPFHRKKGHHHYDGPDGYVLEISCSLEPHKRDTYQSYHATLTSRDGRRIVLVADLREPAKAKQTVRALVRKMNSFIK